MLRSLFDKTSRARQHLTRLDDQPLGRAALVVILFLDLFVLYAIFAGLADQTRQLAAPDEAIPPLCQDIVIDQDWNASNRLDKLAQLVTSYQARRQFLDYRRPDPTREHPLCAPIVAAFEAIRDDAGLARDLGDLSQTEREAADLRAGLERMKGAYDTRLLEKIAGEAAPADKVGALRKEVADKTAALDALLDKGRLLRETLERDAKIGAFYDRLAGVRAVDRTALAAALRQLNFWYPAQRLGMEMLFLLPLLGAFYFWNSRSIGAGRPFQVLVSSHLLAVTMIPVLAKVIRLVYDIIPRQLIRHLIELLQTLKLVAIWHYLVIAAAVAVAMAVAYLFQKKLFSPERLQLRRIARGECHACGLRLPPGSRHCPACGAAQFRTCDHCRQPTLAHGRHCTSCGRETG